MPLQQTFTIVVEAAKVFLATPTPAGGEVGVTYAGHDFTSNVAGGNPATHSFVAVSGLPPGVTLSSDGVLSGTPTTPGTYDLVVEFDD